MLATKFLRSAAAAERAPLIKFLGKRSVPASVDHSRQPHPASPTHSLPVDFDKPPSHASFSSYRDHAQQFGPLRKSIKVAAERGIGGTSGHELGSVAPTHGEAFDRSELPARFRRTPISLAEIEAVETGGATFF